MQKTYDARYKLGIGFASPDHDTSGEILVIQLVWHFCEEERVRSGHRLGEEKSDFAQKRCQKVILDLRATMMRARREDGGRCRGEQPWPSARGFIWLKYHAEVAKEGAQVATIAVCRDRPWIRRYLALKLVIEVQNF